MAKKMEGRVLINIIGLGRNVYSSLKRRSEMSKKVDALLQEYDGLRKELESKGYSGIMKYVKMTPKNWLACRLMQLICEVVAVYIMLDEWVPPTKWLEILLMLSSMLLLAASMWLLSYLIAYRIMNEIWYVSWIGERILPQSSYHAGLILKEKIDDLKAELEARA